MKYGRIILDEPEEDKQRKPEENITPALLEDVATRMAAVVFGIINMTCSYYISISLCALEHVGVEILFVDCWRLATGRNQKNTERNDSSSQEHHNFFSNHHTIPGLSKSKFWHKVDDVVE